MVFLHKKQSYHFMGKKKLMAVLWFLFDNEEQQWAPKFLDVLENTGFNTPFVEKMRAYANQMKDEDFSQPHFGTPKLFACKP